MKKKQVNLKIKLLLPVILMAFLPSHAYSSGFPIVDIPNVAAGVWGNIKKIGEGISRNEEYIKIMKFAEETFALQTDGMNNGAANLAVRKNKAREDIAKKEAEKVFTATPDACNQVAFSLSLESHDCASRREGLAKIHLPQRNAFYKDDEEARDEMALDLVQDIHGSYPSLFEMESEEDNNSQNSQSTPETAPAVFALNSNALLSSSDALLSLDKKQYDAMNNFISLIVPDYSFRNKMEPMIQSLTGDNGKLRIQSKELKRSVASSSLESNLNLRTSITVLQGADQRSNGSLQPSKLYTMSQSIKEASSETALYKIATSEISTPVLLYRQRVLNLAKSVDLQLEQFKRDLSLEAVISTRLATMIND